MKTTKRIALLALVGLLTASIQLLPNPNGMLLAYAGKLSLLLLGFGLAGIVLRRWMVGASALVAGSVLLIFSLQFHEATGESFWLAKYELPTASPDKRAEFCQQLQVSADVLAVISTDGDWSDTLKRELACQFPYSQVVKENEKYLTVLSQHPIRPEGASITVTTPAGEVQWLHDSLATGMAHIDPALAPAPTPNPWQRINPLASGLTDSWLSEGCRILRQEPLETQGLARSAEQILIQQLAANS